MSTELLIRAPVGLLPVLIFLVILLYMDSYKLVGLRAVLRVVVAGGVMAVAAYFVNGFLLEHVPFGFRSYTRYVAPVVEEVLKGAVIVWLFRMHRIGFLVDSAIMGFAVGTGFAVVENFYYLQAAGDAHVAVWIVRGFGTAIMHGGVMAIFAIMSQALTERNLKINPLFYVPGMFVAVTLHSIFNHFVLPPMLMTLCYLVALPPAGAQPAGEPARGAGLRDVRGAGLQHL